MLAFLQPAWSRLASVAYVMAAQALSGIAKDLTKMSAKSAIKVVVPEGEDGALFKWVARLTGSKNALKGAGFFLGGALLTALGFVGSLWRWPRASLVVLLGTVVALPSGMGKAKSKVKFTTLFSKSAAVNWLSAARLFLFSRARCLVRGRIAGLPGLDAWLVFLAGRRLRRRMVRRLRHGPGNRAGDSAPSRARARE